MKRIKIRAEDELGQNKPMCHVIKLTNKAEGRLKWVKRYPVGFQGLVLQYIFYKVQNYFQNLCSDKKLGIN